MRAFFQCVTSWLIEASRELPPEYFQLPVAGREEPCYRERVYCYELYHQWRSRWDVYFPFSLTGELDKEGHPLIREEPKPDFLVHVPGRMQNLLVMEVKPSNAPKRRIRDDLRKLTRFRRDLPEQNGQSGNYYASIFWIYGLSIGDWPDFRVGILDGLDQQADFDPDLVACYLHEQAGVRATQVPWA